MDIMLRLMLVVFFIGNSFAYFEHDENGKSEMNDIAFAQYADFPKKWKLVTVRYREDSNELRFTYANEKASKALLSLTPNYADGAMFGKVSFLLEPDPSFTSSKVPSGTRRYQIMMKNKKKYSSTDGWGYALFDQNGKIYKEDVKQETQACFSCHQIVKERDYVFSRQISFDVNTASALATSKKGNSIIVFKQVNSNELGKALIELLGKNVLLESLEGALKKNSFSGTLDEVIPLLLSRSKDTEKHSILFINEKNYSLIKREGKTCEEGRGQQVKIIVNFNNSQVREGEHCLK